MYLITHDHQLGFKSKHSTDMCIFTVKSIVKYYTRQNNDNDNDNEIDLFRIQ